jgi:F-type H+-transporting ATPase subunit delta
LAEEAHPVEDLDLSEAKKVLAEAQADLGKAGTDVEKAEAQIAVEVAEELVKALAN